MVGTGLNGKPCADDFSTLDESGNTIPRKKQFVVGAGITGLKSSDSVGQPNSYLEAKLKRKRQYEGCDPPATGTADAADPDNQNSTIEDEMALQRRKQFQNRENRSFERNYFGQQPEPEQ